MFGKEHFLKCRNIAIFEEDEYANQDRRKEGVGQDVNDVKQNEMLSICGQCYCHEFS